MRFPSTYLVYDFETTGLETSTCDVIEIGARLIKNGSLYTEKNWLIRIPFPIPDKIKEITGIDDGLLASKGVDEGKAFREFASLAVHAEALVGHNIIRFDNDILIRKATQHGVMSYFEKGLVQCVDTAALYKGSLLGSKQAWYETLGAWSRDVMNVKAPGVKYNLALAHEQLGFPTEGIQAHRTAGDLEMCHRIYLKLTENL